MTEKLIEVETIFVAEKSDLSINKETQSSEFILTKFSIKQEPELLIEDEFDTKEIHNNLQKSNIITSEGTPICEERFLIADDLPPLVKIEKDSEFSDPSSVIKNINKRNRLQYSVQTLKTAMKAVDGGMSVNKASKIFAIPRTTLNEKLKGMRPINKRCGSPTILTDEEEEIIVEWAIHIDHLGFPVTKFQLINSVELLVKKLKRTTNFKNGIPGRHWYERFLKRHPKISKCILQNLTKLNPNLSKDDIHEWFSRIKSYLHEKNMLHILEDPARIFNCGETGVFLNPKENSILVDKRSKQIYSRIANDEKECLTVFITAGANGFLAPPMILFTCKILPDQILEKLPSEWGVGRSDSGWMTCETFYEYVANVFYPWLQKNKTSFPVLLYVDRYSSHITLNLCEFCKEHEIILLAYPNSTHNFQPMDFSVFHPLKDIWINAVHDWRNKSNRDILQWEDFSSLLKTCLNTAAKPTTVRNGFKACGLFPFNYSIDSSKNNFNSTDFSKILLPSKSNIDEPKSDKSFHKSRSLNELKIFLEIFEERLPKETLKSFQQSPVNWEGNEKDENLFQYWKELKNEIDNSYEDDGVIDVNMDLVDDSF